MLLAKLKLKNLPFQTEITFKKIQDTVPPPPVKDISRCEIALISDGGLVPRGNPDRFRSRGNKLFAAYETEDLLPGKELSDRWEIAHTGYSNKEILANPNRLVPVDILKELEKQKIIGRLHPHFYSTSGNATLSEDCRRMGEKIAEQLKRSGVGAILTST